MTVPPLRLATSSESQPRLRQSPTLVAGATRRGEILGTAVYMSPEQARGASVDVRTDIWAFGAVAYPLSYARARRGGGT